MRREPLPLRKVLGSRVGCLNLWFDIDERLDLEKTFLCKCLARIIVDGFITVIDLKAMASDVTHPRAYEIV